MTHAALEGAIKAYLQEGSSFEAINRVFPHIRKCLRSSPPVCPRLCPFRRICNVDIASDSLEVRNEILSDVNECSSEIVDSDFAAHKARDIRIVRVEVGVQFGVLGKHGMSQRGE